MLTFTRDDNNTYIVTANEKFIGRLVKNNGRWLLLYYDVTWVGYVYIPYETSLESTVSYLKEEFNTWLTLKDDKYFGELSYTEYKK